MAFGTLNGLSATSLELRLPLAGAWDLEAEVTTTQPEEVTGPVTVKVGTSELKGVSTLVGADQGGRTTVRVVGGAGGLGNAVEPLHVGDTTLEIVLGAILAIAGETLDAAADPALLTYGLAHWVRTRGDVAEAIRRLAEEAGFTWRITPGGTFWLGTDTWPTVEPAYTIDHEEPTENADTIAIESIGVLPGTTFRGKRVSAVTYKVDAKRCRARVEYGGTRSQLAQEYAVFVRRETAQVDYFAGYDGRIAAQNADGTVEFIPDTSRVPGMKRIPIRGLPGISVKVAPGTRAVLRFGNGSPARPYVSDFEAAGLVEVTVSAAARVVVKADTVEIGEGAGFTLPRAEPTMAWIQAILAAPCASPGSPLVVTPPPLFPLPTLIGSPGPGRTP